VRAAAGESAESGGGGDGDGGDGGDSDGGGGRCWRRSEPRHAQIAHFELIKSGQYI
jgi:hypothetical protein